MKAQSWRRVGFWGVAGTCVSVLATLAGTATAAPRGAWGDEAEATELMVAFRESAPVQARTGLLQRLGLEVTRSDRRLARLRLGQGARQRGETLRSMLRKLRQDPNVRVAEPDFRVHASFTPNDPGYPNLWGLHNTGQTGGTADADIDAPEAWDKTTGSAAVVVAVIDSGVDLTHPDLTENILRNGQGNVVGYDFANKDGNPTDDDGHGSHCAGTIGARGNNLKGIVGVSPVVRIMPVKFLDANGDGNTSDAIAAIDFAVNNGAHILSCSWGGGGYSQLMAEAIQRARNAGVLMVAAAGNESVNNDSLPTYPANYNQILDNVISVAASTDSDNVPLFSNWGVRTVDIAAPGNRVYSTYKGGSYATLDGTSMATPHVAGAAALVKALYPSLSYLQIKTRLLSTVDAPAGIQGKVRTGRLNVNNALIADTALPGSPTGLTATHRAADGLFLAWTASGDDGSTGKAAGYQLRYSTSPITEATFGAASVASALPTPGVSGTSEAYLLGGLTPSTSYYVAVRAMDKVGNYSPLATLGPVSTAPTATAVTPMSDDVEAAPQFGGTGTWAVTTEAFVSPTHSYTDSPGGLYAPNTNSSLTLSNSVLLQGFNPRLEYRIKYEIEEGFDFLLVEISKDGGLTWEGLPVTYTGNSGSWQAANLSLGAYYGASVKVRFRLVTDNIVHYNGVWLDDLRITGMPLQALNGPATPSAPSGFTAVAASQTRVQLNWADNSSDEQGFHLDRRVGNSGSWVALGPLPANTTQFTDETAEANTAYTYRLMAFNGVGNSAATVALVTTPPFAPEAPVGLTAVAGPGSISLTWTASAGAATYILRRSNTAGGPHAVYKTGLTGTSFADTGLAPGTTYYYTVSAVNAAGQSPESAEASAIPQGIPPAAPTNVKAKRLSGRKSKVTWTQSLGPNVAKNRVYRSLAQNGPWTLVAEISPAKVYTDATLVKNTAYYYTVTAVNTAGLESSRSVSAFLKRK